MGEQGGFNALSFACNSPVDLVDLYGLLSGPVKIVGLDKNWPRSQTHTYISRGVCQWQASGKLAITGPDNNDTVTIYPTGESASLNDSEVTAITASGVEALRVTVLRPKFLSRPGGTTPTTTGAFGIVGFSMKFRWRIADQFDTPLPGVPVGERIRHLARHRVVGLLTVTGTGTTDSAGTVGDTYAVYFLGRSGYHTFEQTITVGNWEAIAYSSLFATGTWSGNLRAVFH